MRHFSSLCSFESGMKFMSGDYKAATDYFDSDLSEHCIGVLCDQLDIPIEDATVMRNALTRHYIQEGVEDPSFGAEQTRGQLMGSPVSFPILCLYNATLTRMAHELRWNRKFDLDEIPMLVNGDDLLLQTDDLGYLIWKDVTAFGGLKPSVGKTYVHPTLATINSEMWDFRICTQDREIDPLWGRGGTKYWSADRIRTPLLGLVHGSVKSGGGSSTNNGWRNTELPWEVTTASINGFTNRASMGARWKAFTASCPDADAAWSHMWDRNFDFVKSLPVGTAACIPSWLGGGNIPLPSKTHSHYTERLPSDRQLITAKYLSETFLKAPCQRWSSALNGTDTPAYLKLGMAVDRGVRSGLCLEAKVDDEALSLIPDYRTPPLFPFCSNGLYPLGTLLPESTQEDPGLSKAEKKEILEAVRKAQEEDLKRRCKIWTGIRSASLRCKQRPLSIESIQEHPPLVLEPEYIVV
jgi:hypothetical protein